MLVNSITLNNYRNYSNLTIPLYPNLNIITGPNGIGKTNILESLIVISNTKSFRTNNDQELIQFEKEYSKVEVDSNVGKLKVVINQNNKSLFINNEQIKKASEYIGKINCILFKPSDLELFNTSPLNRRRLLDIELGKINKDYLYTLLTYNKLLKDKNKLLKEENVDNNYLDLIDQKMIPCLKFIINERNNFFNEINSYITNIYDEISNTTTKIEIVYEACCGVEDVENSLFDSKRRDAIYHYATFGIHHDDYYFKFNDYELNAVASQGQKRMAFISFKLALIKFITNHTHQIPIILLDDVLSELDDDNKKRLLNVLPKDAQVIITDTNVKGISIEDEYNLIELKEKKDG